MGTLTVAEVASHDLGRMQLIIATLTPAGTYATNGDTLAETAFNSARLPRIVDVMPGVSGGFVPEWDQANKKLKVFEAGADGGALDEVGNGTDLTSEVFRAWVLLGQSA